MHKRKILFICEGSSDEPKFLKLMMRKVFPQHKYEIYSYNTTIHSRYIEQPVKSWLGNNEYVHYKVVANDISDIRNPNEYKFKWAAVHASQEDLLPTLPDLEEKDYQSEMITPARNIWAIKDNRKELPNDNKTETTLSKTFIDDETYNYGTISTTNYYKG